MTDILRSFFENTSTFDLVYLIITFLSLVKCFRKGLVLSVLAASKWLLAYVITLIIFPKLQPYVKDIINNNYILDISLGILIFISVIFIIIIINKIISKAITYSGLGKLDMLLGFFFGFLRGYIISVCIFSTINIVYNYNKWPINLHESLTFPYVKKGSTYLIKEFPDEKNYKENKNKIEEL